jgi:hypothetical protein
MSTILRNLGFAWRYFVHGEHRSEGHSLEEILAKLDWHESPLVGKYVRTEKGSWWADAQLPALDYAVRLLASGSEPTREQIDAFAKVVARLPALIKESKLEPPPKNDGWGHSPPPFDVNTASISSIWMRDDGVYFLILEVDPEGIYMLAPVFEISSDLQLLSSEWSV